MLWFSRRGGLYSPAPSLVRMASPKQSFYQLVGLSLQIPGFFRWPLTNVPRYTPSPLLRQFLPRGFATGKHTSYSSNNQASDSQATDNVPPFIIGYQRWYPGKEERAYERKYARERAEHHTYDNHRPRKNALLVECFGVTQVEFRQVDEEKECRKSPDKG